MHLSSAGPFHKNSAHRNTGLTWLSQTEECPYPPHQIRLSVSLSHLVINYEALENSSAE